MENIAERNREIVRLYQQGVPVKKIAEKYGLSGAGVYRILKDPVHKRAVCYPRANGDGIAVIKEIRLAKKYPRRELARRTGVSESLIFLLENRLKPVKASKAIALARELGCSFDELFVEKGGAQF